MSLFKRKQKKKESMMKEKDLINLALGIHEIRLDEIINTLEETEKNFWIKEIKLERKIDKEVLYLIRHPPKGVGRKEAVNDGFTNLVIPVNKDFSLVYSYDFIDKETIKENIERNLKYIDDVASFFDYSLHSKIEENILKQDLIVDKKLTSFLFNYANHNAAIGRLIQRTYIEGLGPGYDHIQNDEGFGIKIPYRFIVSNLDDISEDGIRKNISEIVREVMEETKEYIKLIQEPDILELCNIYKKDPVGNLKLIKTEIDKIKGLIHDQN